MRGGNPSHPQSAPSAAALSLPKIERRTDSGNSLPSALGLEPGHESLNDDLRIRAAIAATIKRCALSREQIADAMSLVLAVRVTVRMLDTYSAQSKEANRFPAAWVRAFCKVTSDDTLLRCSAELAGFRLLSQAETALLEMGREYLRRKHADAKLASLEERFRGVDL